MEPMQKRKKLERYRRKLGTLQAFVNVSNKIWVFVDEDHEVEVIIDMQQQLTLEMTNIDTYRSVMVTFVYAKCDAIERIELWDSLYAVSKDMSTPWLTGGDFNIIWDQEEKFGGLPVSLNEFNDFRHCVNTCNVTDLGFKGSIYTWWNGRAEEDYVKENRHADFEANLFILFNHKLKKLKKALSIWIKATYGDIFQNIAILEEVVLVHEAQFEKNPTKQNRERLQKVQAELIKYLALEEQFWQQKSGMNWFQDGDCNTILFHAQEQNQELMKQTTRVEVKQAVFRLNGESARGPDGFADIFFHSCWDIIGDDILDMVKAFFNGQELPKFVTHTNLVLLPKKKEVNTF
nr:uncharacterized protein LOC108943378 [Nicotiana tomentosiformis]